MLVSWYIAQAPLAVHGEALLIELELHEEGVILPVKAQPKASRAEIRGASGGMLKVAVTQVAEKGKANEALVEVISQELGLRRSQLELVSGATSRQKRFLVSGISLEELRERIAAVLAEQS